MEISDVIDISLPRVHDICQTINPGPWGKKSSQSPWNFPCYHYHSFPLLPLSFLSPVTMPLLFFSPITTIIPFPCYHYHPFRLLPLSFLSPVTTIIPFPCYHYYSFPLLSLSSLSPVTTIIPFPCYHYYSFPLLPLSFLSPVTTIIPFPCYHYHSFPLLPLSFLGGRGVGLDVYSHSIRNKKQHGQSPGQNHTLDSSLVLQPGSLASCARPALN
jgi:hypothetical protein